TPQRTGEWRRKRSSSARPLAVALTGNGPRALRRLVVGEVDPAALRMWISARSPHAPPPPRPPARLPKGASMGSEQDDPIQKRLVAAIGREESGYLWVPADAITFSPRVLPKVYGDGRALFALATINQRPAYWVIRGCSTWGCGSDRAKSN